MNPHREISAIQTLLSVFAVGRGPEAEQALAQARDKLATLEAAQSGVTADVWKTHIRPQTDALRELMRTLVSVGGRETLGFWGHEVDDIRAFAVGTVAKALPPASFLVGVRWAMVQGHAAKFSLLNEELRTRWPGVP